MSPTDAPGRCQDAALTLGRDTTTTAVTPRHGPITDPLFTPTDRRARETQEASDARH
ncbi:hypothetical protein [Streptomyces sp. NPDC096013]|uniref:hypothetical protein n=1 Tax=Streptomyces sp. NPDC096013 TaxID=3366069 RepID=UPI003810F354